MKCVGVWEPQCPYGNQGTYLWNSFPVSGVQWPGLWGESLYSLSQFAGHLLFSFGGRLWDQAGQELTIKPQVGLPLPASQMPGLQAWNIMTAQNFIFHLAFLHSSICLRNKSKLPWNPVQRLYQDTKKYPKSSQPSAALSSCTILCRHCCNCFNSSPPPRPGACFLKSRKVTSKALCFFTVLGPAHFSSTDFYFYSHFNPSCAAKKKKNTWAWTTLSRVFHEYGLHTQDFKDHRSFF